MQWAQDLNQNTVDNLNNVRREASRHFKGKKKECLKAKIYGLETNSNIKIPEICRGISDFKVGFPPCSPDLAPSDLYLFPKLKLFLAGQHFFFESRGDCSCRGVSCKSYEEPLQGRDNGAGASLE
jgi:hypothetical protein